MKKNNKTGVFVCVRVSDSLGPDLGSFGPSRGPRFLSESAPDATAAGSTGVTRDKMGVPSRAGLWKVLFKDLILSSGFSGARIWLLE